MRIRSFTASIDHHAGFVVAVIDDDHGILQSLQHLLESAHYDVRLFKSGTALLDSGCLVEIHCLIWDVDMYGMDSIELLERIHAARPGLPTILLVDFSDRLKRLPPLGGIYPGLFTKPFQAEELLAALGDVFRNSPG